MCIMNILVYVLGGSTDLWRVLNARYKLKHLVIICTL